MQYVLFGNTGMEVSRLCLGTMTFGGQLDASATARVVDEALDAGVNFIDTADSYGESETVLGQVLSKERREKIFLATKVYGRFCRDEHLGRNSRTNIINSLDRSLRRLKTDYIDLYQLHHPDEQTPIQETLATLDTLVKNGKIRHFGVSNHYAWQMAYMLGESKLRGWEPLVSYQAGYNILGRQIEAEAAPFCRKFNIAIMSYGPLCGGLLTGKHRDGVADDSRAAVHKILQTYLEDEAIQNILEELGRIAEENGLGMNQLAVLWLMAKADATTIILGGSRPEHFTQIYRIADQTLPQEVTQQIDELSESRIYCAYPNQPSRRGPGTARQT